MYPSDATKLPQGYEWHRGVGLKIGQVQVVINGIPEGTFLQDNRLIVQEESTHQILGTFYVSRPIDSWPLIKFDDYEGNWRKYLCWPQVPLNWVTLTLWRYLSPTAWPCHTLSPYSLNDLSYMAQALANEVGGNLVVAKVHFSYDGLEMIALSGYILRKDAKYKEGRVPEKSSELPFPLVFKTDSN